MIYGYKKALFSSVPEEHSKLHVALQYTHIKTVVKEKCGSLGCAQQLFYSKE